MIMFKMFKKDHGVLAKRRAAARTTEGTHHEINDSDSNLHTVDTINKTILGTLLVTSEFEFHLRHMFCSTLHLKSNFATL